MTHRELATLILRVWGVMLVVDALASLPPILALMQPAGMDANTARYVRMSIVSSTAAALATLAAGVAVVLLARSVAGRIAPESQVSLAGVNPTHIQSLALALLGLYLFVGGLVHLGGPIYALASRPSWDETEAIELVMQQHFEAVIESAISLSCGLVLFMLRSRLLPRVETSDAGPAV